jgi:hypothetical protein
MIDFKYLYQGLCGMARAHQASNMAGHLGAAVAAGYFIGEELPDLDDQVYAGVERDLDRIMAGDESIWFDADKAGISIAELFQQIPVEDQPRTETTPITDALAGNIDGLREAGHNVIFSSIAIRALHDHPQYATAGMVGGIEKLIAGFDGQGPGPGYFGQDKGWIPGDEVEPGEETDFPAYRDLPHMAEVVIDELIRSGSVRRRGFGGLFHVINHAAALTELSRFGFGDLAQRGLPAHHRHIRLFRSLPDVSDEKGPLKAAEHDPRTPEFWRGPDSTQWSGHLTHRIKTIYGFFTLLRFIESADKRKQAESRFLYLMG